jgi:phenylpropionate dioxygenase-like ring-hydroxylating dioxygenase large terminal subunit
MDNLEPATRDQWFCIESIAAVPEGESGNRLLGRDLVVLRDGGEIAVNDRETGRALPVSLRHGFVWTSFGAPNSEVFPIPEAEEPDRRIVACGVVKVKASGLRVVENFLDMAHFPFVHTDILGAEPHTEVPYYNTEIRREVDEVWATNCRFFQPLAALSAEEGMMAQYIYRVMTPFTTLLYKSCPNAEDRWDVICLFVQPVEPGVSRAHPVMFLIDDVSNATDLVHFQQTIFLQDRIILENQRPTLLPLEPGAEIPTRADAASIAYRRWLKEKGVVYGTTLQAA